MSRVTKICMLRKESEVPTSCPRFGVVLLSLVATLVAGGLAADEPAAAETEIRPPPEEADRFLRTPEAMADLTFALQGRNGWAISEVVFGIRKGRLIAASFISQAPDGTLGAVDETEYASALVDDTTSLPGLVYQAVGGETYEVRAFTFGRTAAGEGYVDWSYLIGPDGKPVVTFHDPPPESSDSTLIPQCRLFSQFQCLGLCTGNCVIAGSDPCDCNATGFCFVDFQVVCCVDVACTGTCVLLSTSSCGCLVGATEGSSRECN